MPVHVGGWGRHRGSGYLPRLLSPTRQWLLQPVPHGIRISGLLLLGNHDPVCPTAAMPWDLCVMQASQLQNIQCLDIGTLSAQTYLPCPHCPI